MLEHVTTNVGFLRIELSDGGIQYYL